MTNAAPSAPKLIPALMTLVMLIVLVGLGAWQVQRAAWKHQLIADYHAQVEKEPLIALPPAESSAGAIYRQAALGGKFQHHQSIQLRPHTLDGKQGYQLVTPLKLYTGEIILVMRGFVPDETKDATDQPTGTVAVTGILRPYAPQDWRPQNNPDKDQWYWIDREAVAKKFGLAEIYPLLLVSDVKPVNTAWPQPEAYAPDFYDFHYVYAGIWFSLAIALAVIYLRSQFAKKSAMP